MNYIQKIRDNNPLIHNVTNIVVANDAANATLAIGASPFMASNPLEVEKIQTFANALVINTGTITTESFKAMRLAGKAANANRVPVILDPLGYGAMLAGLLYKMTKNKWAIIIGEVVGTGLLGGLSAYFLGSSVMGLRDIATFSFILPFGLSSLSGSIIAVFMLPFIDRLLMKEVEDDRYKVKN